MRLNNALSPYAGVRALCLTECVSCLCELTSVCNKALPGASTVDVLATVENVIVCRLLLCEHCDCWAGLVMSANV